MAGLPTVYRGDIGGNRKTTVYFLFKFCLFVKLITYPLKAQNSQNLVFNAPPGAIWRRLAKIVS